MAAAPRARLAHLGAEPPGRRFWRRLRLWLRPPRTLKLSPSGRTYLIVTLGVGLGALNTGNNLLYLVLGLLLSLIVLSGVLSERCLRGLAVRRLGTDGAFAQEPFAFRWAVFRQKGHAFALELSEANPHLSGVGLLAHLPPGQEVVVRGDLLAARRGPHHLGQLRVTTRFPFGLFIKTRVFDQPGTLVVYPRRVPPPPPPSVPARGDDGAQALPRRAGGTGDVMGIVPLRDGDDARRIHWGRSAALGTLVRLEREREERRTYLLRCAQQAPSERLERECEEVAATARRLLAQGHEVGLHTPEVRLRPASGPAHERRILTALAHAGFDEEQAR